MKSWKRILFVAIGILVLIPFSTIGCKEKTEDIWQSKEPTKEQMELLEKIYNEFEHFRYYEDEPVKINLGDPHKEVLDNLYGRRSIELILKFPYDQTPDGTLKRGGGDCMDFAVLFVSAAKNIKISARVVTGEVKGKEKPESHAWAEIYYREKWRIVDLIGKVEIVDQTTGEIKKHNIPFNRFVDHPESFPLIKILSRFDEKSIEGVPPQEKVRSEKSKKRDEVFRAFYDLFKQIKEREPSKDELREIKKVGDYAFNLGWEILQERLAKDPRKLIQPDNPELKAWIEKIKAKG